ncbi:MAG TPA: nitroreductase family deazaflavin-dependent oxidoreductase [Ktedonobacterales bacterium]|jgi:deazaflavin-dependent oxidoreductase (nitroreductase family)|nr:nitroreductase family deazaflavin-dependent oxidoreductase [Ktedonobacterales bacterium]
MSGPNEYNQQTIEQFRANGGKADYPGPLVLLTTIGAKSGQPRTTPLAYSIAGDHLVIIASAGGAPTHPDWYYNLVAHPIVTVELGSETFQARATVVEGAERDRLYAQHALVLGFSESDYRQKTTRQIPVIILTRMD